jgi:hypothetical protein
LPFEVTHDEIVRAVRAAAANVSATAVASAFVSALRPRRFEHWSALASYAFASALPEHPFTAFEGRPKCRVCGAYERVDVFASETFARMRAAGTFLTDPRYAFHDLECFMGEPFAEPDDEDRAFFRGALARIAAKHSLSELFPSRLDRKRFLAVLDVAGALRNTLGHVAENKRVERHDAVPVEVAEDAARFEERGLA